MIKINLALTFMILLTSCGQDPSSSKISNIQGHYITIGNSQTFLKKSTETSEELVIAEEKCVLAPQETYLIQDEPVLKGNHFEVNLRHLFPGCGFSKGFIFADHISKSSRPSWRLTGRQKAFLDVIAYAEGTNESYNIRFGHFTFSGYQDHPRILYCSGWCSDAAGRYQFLSTTWDEIRVDLGLNSFDERNQDRAAIHLIRRRGVRNIDSITDYSRFSDAIYDINLEWASLPGSPYGQPTHSMDSLWKKYLENLSQY